jgi:hypothetical protein
MGTAMTRAAFTFTLNPEFGPFLFAAIGTDRNGERLTVLSAFARTSIDPWLEAATLAQMSRRAATSRLAEFISALPSEPNAEMPANEIAGDLIALLPRASNRPPEMPANLSQVLKSPNSRLALVFTVIALVNLIIFLAIGGPTPKSSPAASPHESSDISSTQPTPLELGR